MIELASLATPVTFEENEIILVDRQRSLNLYLVTSGSVNIELHAPTFTVTVLSVGPDERTTALRIAGAGLAAACRRDAELGVEILLRTLQMAAGRIKATEAKFAEMCGVRIQAQGLGPS